MARIRNECTSPPRLPFRDLRLVLTERASRDVASILLYSLQQWGPDQATAYDDAINPRP